MAPLFTLLAAKAKLVGVAVVSAAVGGSLVALQAIATTTPADSATTVTAPHPPKIIHEVADTSVAGGAPVTATGAGPVTATGAPVAAPVSCAGATNHGAYVSSVARGAAHGKLAGRGILVSAAAKSDCGKGAAEVTRSTQADPTRAPKAHVGKPAKMHAATSAPVATRQAPGAPEAPKAARPTDAPEPPDAPEPTDAPEAGGSGGGPGSGQGEP